MSQVGYIAGTAEQCRHRLVPHLELCKTIISDMFPEDGSRKLISGKVHDRADVAETVVPREK